LLSCWLLAAGCWLHGCVPFLYITQHGADVVAGAAVSSAGRHSLGRGPEARRQADGAGALLHLAFFDNKLKLNSALHTHRDGRQTNQRGCCCCGSASTRKDVEMRDAEKARRQTSEETVVRLTKGAAAVVGVPVHEKMSRCVMRKRHEYSKRAQHSSEERGKITPQ
jgi:hypothetical protein